MTHNIIPRKQWDVLVHRVVAWSKRDTDEYSTFLVKADKHNLWDAIHVYFICYSLVCYIKENSNVTAHPYSNNKISDTAFDFMHLPKHLQQKPDIQFLQKLIKSCLRASRPIKNYDCMQIALFMKNIIDYDIKRIKFDKYINLGKQLKAIQPVIDAKTTIFSRVYDDYIRQPIQAEHDTKHPVDFFPTYKSIAGLAKSLDKTANNPFFKQFLRVWLKTYNLSFSSSDRIIIEHLPILKQLYVYYVVENCPRVAIPNLLTNGRSWY